MKYLLLLFSVSFYGQVLHHQMFSSQGTTKKTADGYTISQTIGQQSVIGNSNKDPAVIQGFQQSEWSGYIAANPKTEITVLTYPNPFSDLINFEFLDPIDEEISIYIFDVTGRLIHKQKETLNNSVLTIQLSKLPKSEYLVQLRSISMTYYTKIIKK
ncbi:T9SS type A sorting domain-containing protein [Flavobacterium limnophilum]|uniref:T9SS type A sorting domain-containing protein n=1 Tax=Flavobacterium limnophilum TaxID=3003262 RepID=UPI0022AC123E|nr:T9SS type A sorting domain-containing protein [Flavobacterium limnophilum]